MKGKRAQRGVVPALGLRGREPPLITDLVLERRSGLLRLLLLQDLRLAPLGLLPVQLSRILRVLGAAADSVAAHDALSVLPGAA